MTPGPFHKLSADPAKQSKIWFKHPKLVRKLTTLMESIAGQTGPTSLPLISLILN